MKFLLPFLLGASWAMASEEIEGEVWYDSQGKVAYVEGPADTETAERFVPAWERREKERTDSRPRFYRNSDRRWYGYPGWSVWRPRVVTPHRPWSPCAYPRRGGATILIRR